MTTANPLVSSLCRQEAGTNGLVPAGLSCEVEEIPTRQPPRPLAAAFPCAHLSWLGAKGPPVGRVFARVPFAYRFKVASLDGAWAVGQWCGIPLSVGRHHFPHMRAGMEVAVAGGRLVAVGAG